MTDTDKTTAEAVLDAAIARVRQGWTQYVDARDKDGWEVNPRDSDACLWCMSGAVVRAVEDTGRGSFFASWAAVRAALKAEMGDGPLHPVKWNDADGRTQAEVVAVLERAKRYA